MNNEIVKSGFVSIIGLPNAGKSTFLNSIIKENIAITSKKPQTTRKNLKGIYNDDDAQIVFVDTPGIHSVKNKLDEYMDNSIKKSIVDIDLIVVIVDIMTYESDDFTKLNKIISKNDADKILVINKYDAYIKLMDILKKPVKDDKEIINNIFDKFKGINFKETFIVSSLKSKNIRSVIDFIKTVLPSGNRFYDEEYLTDEPTKQIVSDMIRKQCLYKLNKEIPHGITVIIDKMKKSKSDCINIFASIICERESHKGIIIGKSGQMIKNIGIGARIAIEKFLGEKVNLKLQVLVKENWRDEKTLLANYGYDIKEI